MSLLLLDSDDDVFVAPALNVATTPEAIRDRIIDVIAALTPTRLSSDRFIPFRNERDGNFEKWAKAHAAGCRRRFQVRRIKRVDPPTVSNNDVVELITTMRILVAYPQTHRDGEDAALDRDDTLDADMMQIDKAIGMAGRQNLSAPYPDACWRLEGNGETSRIDTPIFDDEAGIDYGVIVTSYSYRRALL